MEETDEINELRTIKEQMKIANKKIKRLDERLCELEFKTKDVSPIIGGADITRKR